MSVLTQISLLATPYASPVQGEPPFPALAQAGGTVTSPAGDYSFINHPAIKFCNGQVTEVTVNAEPVAFTVELGHVIRIDAIALEGQLVAFTVQDDLPYLHG